VTTQGPGSVTGDVGGIDCGTSCSAEITGGQRVLLTAKSDAGARFDSWSGCDAVYLNFCAVYMSTDHAVKANFAAGG
jgi:hypothetical protein